MNRNQLGSHKNEDKGKSKEITRKRNMEKKGKSEKHDGRDGAVLGKINDDRKNESR